MATLTDILSAYSSRPAREFDNLRVKFRLVRIYSEKVGQGWTWLDKLGQAWTRFGKIEQFWTRLGKIGQGWATLDKFDMIVQGCTRLHKVVQGCTKLNKVKPSWTILDWVDHFWPETANFDGFALVWTCDTRMDKFKQVNHLGLKLMLTTSWIQTLT